MRSKIGWSLVAIYIVIAIIMLLLGRAGVGCREWGCFAYIVLPTLPWIIFLRNLGGQLSYVISVILNVVLLYLIGVGITKLIYRR